MTKQVLAGLALLAAVAPLALGHAVLVEMLPRANTSIAGPNIDIQLRFNSRIDGARSRVSVVFPDHTVRPAELQPQSSPATLSSHLVGLPPGAYKLRWQVLAADGHITRGEVPLAVK